MRSICCQSGTAVALCIQFLALLPTSADVFSVTFDLTDNTNYSSDAGPNPPAGAFWIRGISTNGNVTPGNLFGRDWTENVLVFSGGHGYIAESSRPRFFGSQIAHDTPIDQDGQDPAPYFSWALDVGAGYQLDSFSVSLDGYSATGDPLYPTTSWMGTSNDAFASPSALTFSDGNFDFTAAASSLAQTGSLETRIYTGGSPQFYFDSVVITGSISAVPEPSEFNLMLATGLGFLLRRRR